MARFAAGLLAVGAIVPLAASPGQAITGTVDSSAYGLGGGVTLLNALPVSITNQPVSAYPAGPATNQTAGVNAAPVASTGVINSAANGDPLADTATASSSVNGLSLLSGTPVAIGVGNGGGTVGSSCTANASGMSATASVTNLSIPGAGNIPANPAANTTINIAVLGINIANVILNEQSTSTAGGLRKITVNALHLHLLGGVLGAVGTGDIYIGHSECTTTVPATPTVSAISPVQGPQVGGTTVTIDGTNFLGVSQVLIGGNSAAFTRVSQTRLTATTPAHSPGATAVAVINPAGTGTAGQQFTYLATPTVTAISPASGPAAGGTTVTITGTGLSGATAVTFDGTPATSVTPVNPTTVTAVSPPGAGTDFVQVTSPAGTSASTAAGAFSYVSTPTLTSISPASGPTSGGTTLTLAGTNFTAASQVRVDGSLRPVTYVSDTQLQVVTPAGSAGPVSITATTVGGTTGAQTFTYLAVPAVTSLAPASGTTLGGTPVMITGTGLGSVTGVKVDGTTATVTAQTPTSLTFTTPLHLPGAVGVVLTGPDPITTPAGTYTYVLPLVPPPTDPTVTSLSPITGPVTGGTAVTITGTNLTGATAVSFGGTAATGVTATSATTVTATAPATSTSGPVSVTVTTPAGTSAVSLGGTYTYLPATPTVSQLSPGLGPDTGGTTVTVTGTNFTALSTVSLDNTLPLPATYVDATHLSVTMPPHTAGSVDITVSNLTQQSAARTYTYTPTPTITGLLNPISGPTAGGTSVSLTGTNLNTVTTVEMDGVAFAPDSVTGTTLTFTTPPHATGAVSVLLRDSVNASNANFNKNAGSFLYLTTPPLVTSLSPINGPLAGGNQLTISGTGLAGTSAVSIGGTNAPIVGTPTGTSVVVTVPASTMVGPAALSLTAPGGTAISAYTYNPAPAVLVVLPNQGPDDGGTTVTVTGLGLTGATAVRFGNTAVSGSGFTVVNDTTITVTSPAGSPGVADVTVVTPNGTSPTVVTDRFTYLDTHAVPSVSGVTPGVGPVAGLTPVAITGSGFTGTTAVAFDGIAAGTVVVVSDTLITAVTPAHPVAATVDVTVTGPNGTSPTGSNARFQYVGLGSVPVVAGVTPATGPVAGGTPVTISGVGFSGASAVAFGGTAAPGYTVVNDTTITVNSPAAITPGAATVTVTNGNGVSLPASLGIFTYQAVPTIGTMLPNTGPQSGGTTVTLLGSGFTSVTSVTFGGTAGTSLSISSDSTLTVSTPAHGAGPVSVIVTGPGGASAAATFTYDPSPALTGLAPNTGGTAGGDLVTVSGTGLTGTTSVDFGGVPGTGLIVTSTSILAFTPAHAVGPVDVTVTGPNGTSPVVPAGVFTYAAPAPTLTTVTPNNGPAAGGGTVTLTGTGFTGATGVDFSGSAATDLAISSDTSMTVTVPAHASGVALVTVTGPGGTSIVPQLYTYNALPAVSLVLPNSGPSTGGTAVVITGTNLAGVTAVQFGSVTAQFTNLAGVITATAPAQAAGPVHITVLGPDGASVATNNDLYTYTPPAAPAILAVLPLAGPTAGGNTVLVTGTGFTGATSVTFGGTPGTSVAISSDSSLSVTVPAHLAGAVQVVVTGPGGSSPGSTYTYLAAPALTSMLPTSGPTAGGTSVTITGTGFSGATGVKFGNTFGTGLTAGATSITVTSPAHAAGPVDVQIVTPNGTSNTVPAGTFTFVPPAPTVTGVNPATGSTAGGTVVTLTGTDLTGATSVSFGLTSATPTVVNDTTITVVVPASLLAGAVPVTVTTAAGTSTPGPTFTYTTPPVPTVGSITPGAGSTTGGTGVTVTGTGFTGATSVTLGGATVTFTVVNDSTITFTTPAHAAGPATVAVTTPGGTSTGGPAFSFVAPGAAPVVTGVAPGAGPVAGGTRVTISGVGFTGATQVLFDGVAGTNLQVVNDTTITVTTPAGAGTSGGAASVVVVGPNGSSPSGGAGTTFTYAPLSDLPTISSITPDVGPVAGGTTLTIRGTKFDQYTTVTFDGVAGENVQLGPDVGSTALMQRTALRARAGQAFRAAFSNLLTVDSPAHAKGPVTVTVTNAAGSRSFVQSFTFIPANVSTTLTVKVTAGTAKKVTAEGADYVDMQVDACSTPTRGTATLAADQRSCRYTAPDAVGSDGFVMSVVDVLGQTATQTVDITVVAAGGGSGTGGGGGNETDGGGNGGGTGTGGGGGNETDGGDGSGSGGTGTGGSGTGGNGTGGNGGLAFTGTPFLLSSGLIGGLLLMLVGAGLLTGDRLRLRGRAATTAAAPGELVPVGSLMAGPTADPATEAAPTLTGLAELGLIPQGFGRRPAASGPAAQGPATQGPATQGPATQGPAAPGEGTPHEG